MAWLGLPSLGIMAESAAFVVGLIIAIAGGVILMFRLYHMWWMGERWNNMPSTVSWGFCTLLVGLAVFCVGLFTPNCDGDCERGPGLHPSQALWTGAYIFIAGACIAFCPCWQKKQGTGDVKEDEEIAKWQGMLAPPTAGIDIALMGIGLAVLTTGRTLGVCPVSCAVPVVV
jgi:hypothetical protein